MMKQGKTCIKPVYYRSGFGDIVRGKFTGHLLAVGCKYPVMREGGEALQPVQCRVGSKYPVFQREDIRTSALLPPREA